MPTDKQAVEQHRKIADTFVAAADACAPLHPVTAKDLRAEAKLHRKMADDLDPPQPEWREGDLVCDRQGDLWQFDGDEWCHLHGVERSTASLIRDFGPIRKVRVADPVKHEVVISLDGIDREILREILLAYEDWDEDALSTLSSAGLRAAKAAREQLGGVQ